MPAKTLMAMIVSVSSVVRIRFSSFGAVAAVELSGIRLSTYFTYHSECADHRLHERHWVSIHWCRQAGQTPPVSNVFQSYPQVQNHLFYFLGDQPHSGQRMRWLDGSRVLSRSRSSTRLALSSKCAHGPLRTLLTVLNRVLALSTVAMLNEFSIQTWRALALDPGNGSLPRLPTCTGEPLALYEIGKWFRGSVTVVPTLRSFGLHLGRKDRHKYCSE